MGVSKSIVSWRLGRLEAELGIQLLARTTRGAALTEAGAAFRDHASRVVAEIEMACETILPDGDLQERLRLAPLSVGPSLFAPVLAEMGRRHRQLHIHAVYSDRFVDLITEGFDCSIRVGFLNDSNLLSRRVGPFYSKLVASPGYLSDFGAPQTPDELLAHEVLMQGTEPWQFRTGNKVETVQQQGRFKADTGSALVSAALAGLGIAWLPDCLVDDHIASGDLVPVLTGYPPPDAGIYVVRPPKAHFLLARFRSSPNC